MSFGLMSFVFCRSAYSRCIVPPTLRHHCLVSSCSAPSSVLPAFWPWCLSVPQPNLAERVHCLSDITVWLSQNTMSHCPNIWLFCLLDLTASPNCPYFSTLLVTAYNFFSACRASVPESLLYLQYEYISSLPIWPYFSLLPHSLTT